MIVTVIPLTKPHGKTLRYLAETTLNSESVKRVLIATIEHDAALLFPFSWRWEGGGMGDYWFESVAAAIACVQLDYGVLNEQWYTTEDALDQCAQDWVTPARLRGNARLELLLDGKWTRVDKDNPPRIEIDYNSLHRLAAPPR